MNNELAVKERSAAKPQPKERGQRWPRVEAGSAKRADMAARAPGESSPGTAILEDCTATSAKTNRETSAFAHVLPPLSPTEEWREDRGEGQSRFAETKPHHDHSPRAL